MKSSAHRPAQVVFVHAVVTTLLTEGADLRAVTLDEFKERLKHTIRGMALGSQLAAA